MNPKKFFLVQNYWNIKQIRRGGWYDLRMDLIDPNWFGIDPKILSFFPNWIPIKRCSTILPVVTSTYDVASTYNVASSYDIASTYYAASTYTQPQFSIDLGNWKVLQNRPSTHYIPVWCAPVLAVLAVLYIVYGSIVYVFINVLSYCLYLF